MARNPLLAFLDTSKRPPRNPGIAGVEEREIVLTDPELEYYEGDNNAWRGTEQHGVASQDHAKAYEVPAHNPDTAEIISPIPEEAPKDPIDVRVVNEYSSERRAWRTSRETLMPKQPPRQIVNRNENRSKLIIKVLSFNDIFINHMMFNGLENVEGFMVTGESEFAMNTEDAVFAVADWNADDPVQLCIYEEYSVEL